MDIYSHKVGFGCTLCFEWFSVLVWFYTLLTFRLSEEEKKLEKHLERPQNKENRRRDEIYFLGGKRDFPL